MGIYKYKNIGETMKNQSGDLKTRAVEKFAALLNR